MEKRDRETVESKIDVPSIQGFRCSCLIYLGLGDTSCVRLTAPEIADLDERQRHIADSLYEEQQG